MSEKVTAADGTTPEKVEFVPAQYRSQNRTQVAFHSGVTYIRPNGGVPGQIHVNGAGFLSRGVAEQLIQALAGACIVAKRDEEIGSMGEQTK